MSDFYKQQEEVEQKGEEGIFSSSEEVENATTAQDTLVVSLQPLSLGEQFRNFRAEAGLTSTQLAEKANCPHDFIINLEKDALHNITQHSHYCKAFIHKICLAFGIDSAPLIEQFVKERALLKEQAAANEYNPEPGVKPFIFDSADLTETKSGSVSLHLPAILIGFLLAVLVLILSSAWFMQRIRIKKNDEISQSIEEKMPELIKLEALPLEVLPIPNN
jgi:cytoskeletal protein RodZ